MKKFKNFIIRVVLPASGAIMAFCIFVANHSPNLCIPAWSYEEEMPESLKDLC